MNSEINLNEEFGYNIFQTVMKYNLRRNIEIGSWDGGGSTKCFVEAMKLLGGDKCLTCIEIDAEKYKVLVEKYKNLDYVVALNTSSISYDEMKYKKYDDVQSSKYNNLIKLYPESLVKTWFDRDLEELKKYQVGALNGLLGNWDSVLIDGGEFTGYSEYSLIKDRVDVIFLDDVHNAFKCNEIYHELVNNSYWDLLIENSNIRNGYAIFKKHLV